MSELGVPIEEYSVRTTEEEMQAAPQIARTTSPTASNKQVHLPAQTQQIVTWTSWLSSSFKRWTSNDLPSWQLSRLCLTCQSLVDNWRPEPEAAVEKLWWWPHHNTEEQLRHSAETGCTLCYQFVLGREVNHHGGSTVISKAIPPTGQYQSSHETNIDEERKHASGRVYVWPRKSQCSEGGNDWDLTFLSRAYMVEQLNPGYERDIVVEYKVRMYQTRLPGKHDFSVTLKERSLF